MKEKLEKIEGRINDCALRENMVSNLKEVQTCLEKEMNTQFSHSKFHMQNFETEIKNTQSEFQEKISDIKKKTLGKITGKHYI